jgi:gluconokinase
MIVIVMGVSGSGKTTIGQKLAARLGCSFFDADHFHPRANILKMATGKPLTDDDRRPWLDTLRGMIEGWLAVGASAVLACSALKQSYRDILIQPDEPVALVYLRGSYDTILARMQGRSHFFKPEMLRSQFDALEEPSPQRAIVVDIDADVDAVVAAVEARLR